MSQNVQEEPFCQHCHHKLTDAIRLTPDCADSMCVECHQKMQQHPGGSGYYECTSCNGVHVMPIGGFENNKGVVEVMQKEKILDDDTRMLKSRVATLEEKLDTLKSFDGQDRINVYCDELVCDVLEAFDSAIKHFNELEKETVNEIQEYRRNSLEAWSARAINQPEAGQPENTQQRLDQLETEISEFSTTWGNLAKAKIHSAISESDSLVKRMRSLKVAMMHRLFQDRLMLFKPHISLINDKSYLKKIFHLSLETGSVEDKFIQEIPQTVAIHKDQALDVVFLPNGRVASCSMDETIKIWNASSGTELVELKDHAHWVVCLVKLPNGWLASCSEDMTIKIWDLDEGKAIRTLTGHTGAVFSLKVLKSGQLASYSADDTIRIWDPHSKSDNLLRTMNGHGNQTWLLRFDVLPCDYLVTFSRALQAEEECIMRVWNPSDGKMIKAISTGLAVTTSNLALFNGQVAIGFGNGTIVMIDWIADSNADDAKKRKRRLIKRTYQQWLNFQTAAC